MLDVCSSPRSGLVRLCGLPLGSGEVYDGQGPRAAAVSCSVRASASVLSAFIELTNAGSLIEIGPPVLGQDSGRRWGWLRIWQTAPRSTVA